MKNWQLTFGAMAVVVLAIAAVPQDVKHAPTIESCVADLNLWTSQIPGWPSNDQMRSGTKSLTTREIDGRVRSIIDCSSAYPVLTKSQSNNIPAGEALLMTYGIEEQMRYFDFLERHSLLNKFNEEDEAGQR